MNPSDHGPNTGHHEDEVLADALRGEIVRHATDLILRHGHRAVTVQSVAQATGLPPAEVNELVGDLDHLFVAVLADRDVQDIAEVRRSYAAGIMSEPREALHALVARNAEQPQMLELYMVTAAAALDPNHPAHAYFVRRYEESIDIMADIVRETSAAPERTAEHIMAVLDGLQQRWLVVGRSFDLVESWDALADHVLTFF